MTMPVAPELFDTITEYAKKIEQGKVALDFEGTTSDALVFCQNFYLQFFQNRMGQQILGVNQTAKNVAIRLRLEQKDKNGPVYIIQLLTLFEELCQNYPDLLPLSYGEGRKTDFINFHHDYLPALLERAASWAKAEKLTEIEEKANSALADVKNALQYVKK